MISRNGQDVPTGARGFIDILRSSEGAVQLRYLRDAAVLVAPEDLAGGFASKRAAANANGLRWRAVDWCGGQ
ncbi:hypothetical protein, partial [Mesorhizobium sp.]|uniref:hypothetical protein n=1 Tax=Mesorhizobium sp. TaxID=1871066 RepID=UPI0025FEE943